MRGGRAAPAVRRERAAESFACAAECLGRVGTGTSLFALTRGQWSMIDAVLHIMDCCTNGTIVAHPRTGAPLDNPYLRVRSAAERAMKAQHRVKRTDRLWGGK